MDLADAYSRLGVGSGASDSDVRAAYLALAKKTHPDAATDAACGVAFSKVKEAYDVVRQARKDGVGGARAGAGAGAGASGLGAGVSPGAGAAGAGIGGYHAVSAAESGDPAARRAAADPPAYLQRNPGPSIAQRAEQARSAVHAAKQSRSNVRGLLGFGLFLGLALWGGMEYRAARDRKRFAPR